MTIRVWRNVASPLYTFARFGTFSFGDGYNNDIFTAKTEIPKYTIKLSVHTQFIILYTESNSLIKHVRSLNLRYVVMYFCIN